jgi:ribosomal protein S18 acetylase RimI-like enzyme
MPSPSVSFRPARSPDHAALRSLWLDRFGGRREAVDRWIEAAFDDRYQTTAHVASTGDPTAPEIVGFGMFEIGDRAYTREYLGLESVEAAVDLAPRNGIMHMYCVRRDWENRGIATRLYARHLRCFVTAGLDRAVGISWERSNEAASCSRFLFEKFGFGRHGPFDRFYDRVGRRENCPDCGDRCFCPASVYTKRLEAEAPAEG